MGQYHIGDAIKSMVNTSRLKSGIRSVQITTVWEELMGKTIAKYTEHIQIVNQTLFITTSVGPLKNELMYQKAQIIDRINEVLGENMIKEVIIK
jgi:hypothetical protein